MLFMFVDLWVPYILIRLCKIIMYNYTSGSFLGRSANFNHFVMCVK